ncbi:MAG: hypothetical protein COA44_04300 [Arcobacter sp.]|nr:MAG: hypothetical protein COA44_04300 [Arcobacter sp.]
MTPIELFAVTVFTSYFAIMNPIANTPIFMGLTQGADSSTIKKLARRSTLTAFIIVLSFIVLGQYIFSLFGLSIAAFKLAGGILIFHVGYEMIQSKVSSTQDHSNFKIDESIAVSPIAIPILAGPGTIVTAMNNTIHVSYIHVLINIAMLALMLLLTFLAFSYSGRLVKIIGNNSIVILGKLMGVILTVIGTGMVIDGIKLAFNLA